jgi:hypothetical protein
MEGVDSLQVKMRIWLRMLVVMAMKKTWTEMIQIEFQVQLPDPKMMIWRAWAEERKNDLKARPYLSVILSKLSVNSYLLIYLYLLSFMLPLNIILLLLFISF